MGRWPGLHREALEGPGDVPVVQDYRDLLGAVLARHGGRPHLGEIFPGHFVRPLAV